MMQQSQTAQIEDNQRILDQSGFGQQGVDPQEQLRNQIQLMMTSPIASVRKQGLTMLEDYSKAQASPKAQVTSAAFKQATDMGLTPGTAEHRAMVERIVFKPNSAVNVSVGGKDFVSPEEANILRYKDDNRPVDPFTDKASISGKVYSLTKDQVERSENAKRALPMIDKMENMLFDQSKGIMSKRDNTISGKVNDTISGNVNVYTQDNPHVKEYIDYRDLIAVPFAKTLGTTGGDLSNRDMERIESVIPNVTGINIDTPEVARLKLNNLRKIMYIYSTNGMLKKSDLDNALKEYEAYERKVKSSANKNIQWKDGAPTK